MPLEAHENLPDLIRPAQISKRIRQRRYFSRSSGDSVAG
jgi:hypothetical protein